MASVYWKELLSEWTYQTNVFELADGARDDVAQRLFGELRIAFTSVGDFDMMRGTLESDSFFKK